MIDQTKRLVIRLCSDLTDPDGTWDQVGEVHIHVHTEPRKCELTNSLLATLPDLVATVLKGQMNSPHGSLWVHESGGEE